MSTVFAALGFCIAIYVVGKAGYDLIAAIVNWTVDRVLAYWSRNSNPKDK